MQIFTRSERLMGSAFTIAVCAEDAKFAQEILEDGIAFIRNLEFELSEFIPESTTSQLKEKAGSSHLKVSPRFFSLVERSLHISKMTQGAFDITIAPLKRLYSFNQKKVNLPSRSSVTGIRKLVGSNMLEMDKNQSSILLRQKGMSISFAGIGKGFAADALKKHWQESGVESGYINASGDISAFGNKPDGKPWIASISNPEDKENILFAIPLMNRCIATSGDYIQYFKDAKGHKYSHTLDPRTGYPVKQVQSVSVISPSAELSDALATAATVLPANEAISLINQLAQCYVIIINDKGQVLLSKEMEYFQIAP